MQGSERLDSAQQEAPARPHLHKSHSREQLLGISCHLPSLPGSPSAHPQLGTSRPVDTKKLEAEEFSSFLQHPVKFSFLTQAS